ncbi:DUF4124 domain-containing protein [Luteimonas huabeiensis]|uniref:DUF4124 domain-containing protein n=1 Tax=Luteimonas huabeiensis TaxID=1244513 RepID=UPI0004B899B0|nr:DUF4124 domain-containing protein [Luteimonas huabeiensis]
MPDVRPIRVCALLALATALPLRAADEVTLYRCTDAHGRVTLQDAPCTGGARQQTRVMQRPQDPPPRPPPPPVPAPPAQVVEPAQVAVLRAPQPMYECVTPEGERYLSDDGEGNPRFVPLWTLGGHDARGPRPARPGQRGATRPPATGLSTVPINNISIPSPRNLPQAPPPPPVRPRPPHPDGAYYGGGGTWIRDACTRLPQAEVCSRLRDQRETLRRRFFNAQESERSRLRVEERTLNARLAEDCGIR